MVECNLYNWAQIIDTHNTHLVYFESPYLRNNSKDTLFHFQPFIIFVRNFSKIGPHIPGDQEKGDPMQSVID